MLFCWECEGEIDGVSDCHPFCSAGCEEDYDARMAENWEDPYDEDSDDDWDGDWDDEFGEYDDDREYDFYREDDL